MMIYQQDTGLMFLDGAILGEGYSGQPPYVNSHADEDRLDLGPIPCGLWSVGPAYEDGELGPLVMNLDAMPGTPTYDRIEFRIHGDSITNPGYASKGCIVMPESTRLAIIQSKETLLSVRLSSDGPP